MQDRPHTGRTLKARAVVPAVLGFILGALLLRQPSPAFSTLNAAAPEAKPPTAEVAALQTEITRLQGMVPDQSHAMTDVASHYANLWFAGQNQNWPLAKFYFDETRSHLNWAVRIIPVRKTHTGADVDLKAILQAIDASLLSPVGKAIDSKNRDQFVVAYRQSLEGCYSCHKASEKPYLRPRVPEIPATSIINFNPEATWPQ